MAIVLLVTVLVGGLWILVRPPVKVNSVAGLARYYGVSKETVLGVAHAYGVDPQDLDNYGPQPFPVNYIMHELDKPGVTRAQVEALVTGYVSKCERDNRWTVYLFYSDWLEPKTLFRREEALPLEIYYELDPIQDRTRDDQIVQRIQWYILGDSGGAIGPYVGPHCNPPVKY